MSETRRDQAQILRLYDQVRSKLQSSRDVLDSPGVQKLLRDIRRRTGAAPEEDIGDIVRSIEDAVRVVQLAESDVQAEMRALEPMTGDEWAENLPPRLARFLQERDQLPGFHWEVVQDEVRGWMVLWKEHTEDGRIRGYGQFYERPYAWLDD